MTARLAGTLLLLSLSCSGPLLAQRDAEIDAQASPRGDTGTDPGEQAVARPIQFRTIYAPDKALDSFDGVFLPMERSEFKRRLAEIQRQQTIRSGEFAARIAQSVYSADLVGDNLVNGRATLAIKRDSTGLVALPLVPMNLAIEDPQWEASDQASAPAASDGGDPARMGLVDSSNAVLFVDRSADLQFSWSLCGVRESTGELRFRIALPVSPVIRMELQLPPGLTPVADSGVTSRLPHDSAAPPEGDPPVVRWAIELSGNVADTVLRLVPSSHATQSGTVMLQDTTLHRLSETGIETNIELQLDVFDHPVSELRLTLTDQQRLIEATLDGESLAWTSAELSNQPETLLELPTPLTGQGHIVRLRLLAPPPDDNWWSLKGVTVHDVRWREGSITLEASEPLNINHVDTENCREVFSGPLPPPRVGQLLRFQCFQPEAELHVLASEHDLSCVARIGTTIKLTPTSLNAVAKARIVAEKGARFELDMDASADWTIDQIESIPPGLLDDWKEVRSTTRNVRYRISLKQAITADQPLDLLVQAHRRRRNDTQSGTTGRDLRVIQFPELMSDRQFVAVGAEAPYQVALRNDAGVERLQADALPETDASLIDLPPGGLVYRDGPSADRLAVLLSSDPPRFEIDIDAETQVTAKQLIDRYEITCQPQESSVSRLLIHFTDVLSELPEWVFYGPEPEPLKAVRLGEDEQSSEGLLGGETWRIELPSPQGTPFRLTARSVKEFTSAHSVALASVAGATSQTASLTVRSLDGTHLSVQTEGLKSIPVEPVAGNQYTTARLALRYLPTDDAQVIVSRADALNHPAQAYVWSCCLMSRIAKDGTALHRAVYQIENAGSQEIALDLPADAKEAQVWLNQNRLTLPNGGPSSRVKVALPAQQRLIALTVCYVTHVAPIESFATIRVSWPRVDLPVVHRTWDVWIPPGFEFTDGSAHAAQPRWRERLLGPLARPSGISSFNPLHRKCWSQLFHREADNTDRGSVDGEADAEQAIESSIWPDTIDTGLDTTHEFAEDDFWQHRTLAIETSQPNGKLDDNETTLAIRQRTVVAGIAWGAFLAGMAVVLWLIRRNSIAGAWGVLTLAALALLGPAAMTSVLSALFLGGIGGWLLYFAYTSLFPLPELAHDGSAITSDDDSLDNQLASTATVTAVLLAMLLPTRSTTAQDQSITTVPGTAPIYRVLSPIDENQEPTGEYVYVAEPLYHALMRHGEASQTASQRWMIRSAEYRSAFFWNVAPGTLDVTDLKAAYDIEVFRPLTRLRLPIREAEAAIEPNSIRLDGQLLTTTPAIDAMGIDLLINKPGVYSLEFTLRPRVFDSGSHRNFEISIPPVPNSRLSLALPPEGSGVEVAGAAGATTLNPQTSEMIHNLGPSSRLTVSWPLRSPAETPVSRTSLEQLMWLDVQPQWAMLRARFRFSADSGQVQQFPIAPDKQLSLLSTRGCQLIRDPDLPEGSLMLRRVPQGVSSVSDEAEVVFLVDYPQGEINLKTPLVDVEADQIERRWLALSIGEGMACEATPVDDARYVDATEFAEAWGPPQSTTPSDAYSLPSLDAPLSIRVHRDQPSATAEQRLDVSLSAQAAEFTFHADVAVSGNPVFQYAIDVPSQLTVTDVSVVHESVERVSDWTRDSKGKLYIRVDGPLLGPNQLRVDARLANPRQRAFSLPVVSLTGIDITSNKIHLYRQPTVRIDALETQGYIAEADPAIGRQSHELGRLSNVLVSEPGKIGKGHVKLTLAPNRPRLSGRLAIELNRSEQSWLATLHHRVSIDDPNAILDVLRYEIPPGWKEPFEVVGAAELDVVEVPGSEQRRLEVRPTQPVTREFEVQVTGQLAAIGRDKFQPPDIRPLDIGRVERLLILPTQVDGRAVRWETRGLSHVAGGPTRQGGQRGERLVYRVTQPDFSAVLDEDAPVAKEPAVRMAEYRLAFDDKGDLVGSASFDVLPAGARQCTLVMPAESRPVGVWLGGVPALMQRTNEQTWDVSLDGQHLPVRLLLLFTREDSSLEGDSSTAALPKLLDMPPERELWAIRHATSTSAELSGARRIDRPSYTLARMDNLLSIMTAAAEVTQEQENRDVQCWLRHWTPYWEWDRGRIREEDEPDESSDLAHRLASMDEQAERLSERLGGMTTEAAEAGAIAVGPAVRPYDLWPLDEDAGGMVTEFFSGEEGAATIAVKHTSHRIPQGAVSRLAGMIALLIVIIGVLLARNAAVFRKGIRSPLLIGVGMSLVCWLWMAPSGIGFVAFCACAALLATRAIRQRRWPQWS